MIDVLNVHIKQFCQFLVFLILLLDLYYMKNITDKEKDKKPID